jgi:hypothetical protein
VRDQRVTIARIIRRRAGVSNAHASMTWSNMSSSDISCRPRGAGAISDALEIEDAESPMFTEVELMSDSDCRSGGCGFESRRAR